MTKIKLHEESKKYMKEVLSRYKEVEDYFPTSGNSIIIHLYPKEDTRDLKTGELNGYFDTLFFEAHIYYPEEKTLYKSRHDSITFYGIDVNKITVKVFKDGSTMITISERVTLSFCTTLNVYGKKVTK